MNEINHSVQFTESLILNAWPSLQTLFNDGWLLRFAQGYSQRANSVSIIHPSAANADLIDKIRYCEQCYSWHDQPTIFKITPAVQTENERIDQVLTARGYAQNSLTSVQTADISILSAPHIQTVTFEPTPTAQWLESYCRLNQTAAHHIPVLTQILNNIFVPHCFVALQQDQQTVAVGLAVVERGYVGIYNVVIDAAFRNRGWGTQLLLHLLTWAKTQGAQHAYLCVTADNEPALRLYKKLGFQELYRYWYRVKMAASADR
jgi:ribosomal protein S18 acetylase RimI-like enzyme